MKCQILFPGKYKRNLSKCHLLKILPRVLGITDRHARTNSIDPDQTIPEEQFDQGLICFPFYQDLLGSLPGPSCSKLTTSLFIVIC